MRERIAIGWLGRGVATAIRRFSDIEATNESNFILIPLRPDKDYPHAH